MKNVQAKPEVRGTEICKIFGSFFIWSFLYDYVMLTLIFCEVTFSFLIPLKISRWLKKEREKNKRKKYLKCLELMVSSYETCVLYIVHA